MIYMIYDILIVGGGPAGLTAATYCRRAGKSVLVTEKACFGGQITWSPRVENFPSCLSISGAELGDRMTEQAIEQGAELVLEEVVSAKYDDGLIKLVCESGAEYEGRTLIIATGARPRPLGLEHEQELIGNGIGYCAVCDAAFFKGRVVAVNGGGNSALQDAMLLSEKASKVYLIHRRAGFRGEAKLLENLRKRENVEILTETTVTKLLGENELEGISVCEKGREHDIALDGLFIAVGHEPDNTVFRELIDLDAQGYADAGESCATKLPCVFAAGDCRRKSVRQLTTAAADGSIAALAACAYLDRA